jgi:lipopolysaccharide/colanic/teichoic acid biosynthesis glycosyltransferase
MPLRTSLMVLNWIWRTSGGDELAGLPSPAQTRRLLQRERMRSDRTGSPFSVIAFHAADPGDPRESMAWLVRFLKGRLRETDEVGWLDDSRLCAILPVTPVTGAATVVADMTANFPADLPALVCQIYSHPLPDFSTEQRAATAEPAPAPLAALFAKRLPAWKRALDLLGAFIALVLLSPLLLLIALTIRLTSPGPAIFRQRRAGLGGRPFTLFKFRTMVPDAEARKQTLAAHNEQDGPAFKMRNDPRVTFLGRFLRATSLDELPQLFNVLWGDMSLVGPRPLPLAESERCEDWQQQRLDTLPGITCIWQVYGRCRVPFTEWMRMDIRYTRKHSLFGDLKLILRTIPAVLFQRGAQ